MKRSLIQILFASLVCTITTSVWGANLEWFGSANDRDWFNTANWGPTGGPIPTGVDNVELNYASANSGPVINAPDAVCNQIIVSYYNASKYHYYDYDSSPVEQILTVATGGVLTTNDYVILGFAPAEPQGGWPPDEGSLIINGGTANLLSHLFVGFGGIGHLEVDSGTCNVLSGMFGLGWNGGTGTVNLNGGVLHTEQWNFNRASSYRFDITGGEWIQNHFWVNEIQALVNTGKITAYGGAGTVNVTWDPVFQQTHVIGIIPEPASATIMTLASLFIALKRKKR